MDKNIEDTKIRFDNSDFRISVVAYDTENAKKLTAYYKKTRQAVTLGQIGKKIDQMKFKENYTTLLFADNYNFGTIYKRELGTWYKYANTKGYSLDDKIEREDYLKYLKARSTKDVKNIYFSLLDQRNLKLFETDRAEYNRLSNLIRTCDSELKRRGELSNSHKFASVR